MQVCNVLQIHSCVVVNGKISFLKAEKYSIIFLYHISFLHSFVDAYLGGFHTLPIVNNTAVNKGMQISL